MDDDLGVDPGLRPAVEAALGELARAYVVEQAAVGGLGGERGQLAVRERIDAADRAPGGGTPADIRRLEDALTAAGGGRLRDAIRRDESGAARALLERAVWAPDLDAAVRLQPLLPLGWLAVTRDGGAVLDPFSVRMGRGDSPLEARAEGERLAREAETLEREAAGAQHDLGAAEAAVAGARAALDGARAAESTASAARRRAEEAERTAGRALEASAREAAWQRAQADRLATELERVRAGLAALEAPAAGDPTTAAVPSAGGEPDAIAAWEARLGELRTRRDRLAAEASTQDRARRDAEARRAGAEAAASLAERRIATADGDMDALGVREQAAADERTAVAGAIAEAKAQEARAREALEVLLADDRVERGRLADAERAATAARERLRVTDDRARASDVAAMEARLNLESLREQVLVELAGMGEVGLRHLAEASGVELQPPDEGTVTPTTADVAGGGETAANGTEDGGEARSEADGSAEGAALEAALERLAPTWSVEPPPVEPPTPGRLAVLRRRFHELGAANPFAVDEYRSVRDRLETLEAQHRDLRDAIARTRSLIADLDELIATQFRSTFAALEVAFDARFQQLFGGGFARLSLTDPTDLATTGIEITARPPGKKPQALAMLSGGERALTAVALLFAMLEVRPAPFCVLDEVDAALDEANVGRFTEALQSLAQQTQFIVITHNRGTIEVADALYGVTVGDDSVSRVISLRLDEAQAIADDRRSEARAVLAGEPG